MEAFNLNTLNQDINGVPHLHDVHGTKNLNERLLALEVRANNADIKLSNQGIDNHSIDVDMLDIHYLVDLCSEKIREINNLDYNDKELMAIDIEYYMFELSNKVRDIEEFLIYEKKLVLQ